MQIVGLSGYARTGKDTVAEVLVEEFGYTRIGFADKLRDVLYALNPLLYVELNKYEIKSHQNNKPIDFFVNIRVQDVINQYGWDGYKETEYKDEIRYLLQRLGTEAGRQTLWDSIWVDAAFANLDDDAKVVVTDCRFENEAKAIADRGGELWRINRAGVGPINNHISETGLDEWPFDKVILNHSTLEQFRDKIRSIA